MYQKEKNILTNREVVHIIASTMKRSVIFMDIKEVLYFARVKSISFENFRNIEKGTVTFPNSKANEFIMGEPSLLGLYGQNGSGKSSVIMALGILKSVLSGRPLGENYMSCIRYGYDRCKLSFVLSMYQKAYDDDRNEMSTFIDGICYDIFYDFDITSDYEESDSSIDGCNQASKKVLRIENEVIRLRCTDADGTVCVTKQILIDARRKESDLKGRAFGNEAKYDLLTGTNLELQQQLRELKAVAYAKSQSFIFSTKVLSALISFAVQCISEIENVEDFADKIMSIVAGDSINNLTEKDVEEFGNLDNLEKFHTASMRFTYLNLLKSMRTFGLAYLHVIDTTTTGLTNINRQLPLLLWNKLPQEGVLNLNVALQMDGPTQVPEKVFSRLKTALNSVNEVLGEIIPGLTLGFRDLGMQISQDNNEEHRFEIMSIRGDTTIPLKYESDGIRRIVSILSLLIAAYNEASFTIAIDEIDSGIFEYLLGELLQVLSESLRGQMIFTSHNLRPLEVLPAKYLCFTTTNPGNHFTKIANRGNSNLRDTYFRSIILGTDKDAVYNPTDKYRIEMALYRAGHYEEGV